MSAREMDRCECELGHTGPLMVLVGLRCSGDCDPRFLPELRCSCCSRTHRFPYAGAAGCFRQRYLHFKCGAPVLLVLEPLATFAGVES